MKNNPTPIIGLLNCVKVFIRNYILLKKQEPIFIKTKKLNQDPNIKAQTSDEIQPLHEYENSTVVFDGKLLSKQERNINLFLQEDVTITSIFIIFLKVVFTSQKRLFVKILKKIIYRNKHLEISYYYFMTRQDWIRNQKNRNSFVVRLEKLIMFKYK